MNCISAVPAVTIHKFAHELKNPLAICSGYLEMIPKSDETSKERYYKIIEQEIKRSLKIIQNFSKETTLEKEEIDLTYLLEEVKETLIELFQKSNSEIIILEKEEHYIEGDYEKLKQVFLNLLKNAWEARSHNKLLIIVKVLCHKDYYEITITDNGKGMSEKELKSIKKEYYTTKENGTGLGIPFCQDIMNLHKGTIHYKSKPGIGTKVSIFLPKKKSPKTFNSNNYY